MKKAISLFFVCVILLLSMSGCSGKAQKDSLAARAGLTSSSQIEGVTLHAGYHPDEWPREEKPNGGPNIQPIDLTGTEEGNKYIEALFSEAAVDTKGPVRYLGFGNPLNGTVEFALTSDDSLDYTQIAVSIYRDETPYTVFVILTYTDDKRWELMQDDNYADSDSATYLLPDTREIWSREYIDSIFAAQEK